MKSVVTLLLFLSAGAWAQTDQIHFHDGIFTVTGFTGANEPREGWSSVFPVFTAGNEAQPMLGTYTLEGDTLTFRPRYPIAPGVPYQARLIRNGQVVSSAFFDPPPSPPPTAHIVAIYPSADRLPVNTLRMYIYFSAPMSRGEAWQHIHLRTDDGAGHSEEVRLAFLQIEQELWDPELRRLTLLFDPGRIKRGLVPARQLGTPLKEGTRYRLSIDKDWLDARGIPLARDYEKNFTGIAADRTPPAPKRWRIAAPRAGRSDPVVVTFPKPMDYALLQRMIEVQGVPGHASIGADETEWRFTPDAVWKPGRYTVSAENTLEDIAGNHLDRPFDVDLSRDTPVAPGDRRLSVSFTVR